MTNPLKQFYRHPKITVKLPSKGQFNHPGFFELAPDGSLPVCAMTANDEMNLKSPDLLMNGQAMVELLKSCVHGIKGDPYEVTMSDMNALLLGIKYSTFGDSLDFAVKCPECNESLSFERSIQLVLDQVSFMAGSYSVKLPSGIQVVLKPHSFRTGMKQVVAEFHLQKLLMYAEKLDSLNPEEKASMIGKTLQDSIKLRTDLITDAIVNVMTPDRTVVEDRDFIEEFVREIEAKDAQRLHDKIREINEVGISTSQECECTKCGHQFVQQGLYWNPSDFFG